MCPASRHEPPRRNRPPITRRWSPTARRYRRRLSVHASRSGTVSLPALKGHLQHVTDEMRVYCSDGFCRTVNLVFDNEHFRLFCDHFRRPRDRHITSARSLRAQSFSVSPYPPTRQCRTK
ncbi:hypothetical protein D7207_29945 [Burkholderia cepacia]|nr:hypothetical protein [Burkholderia cepacia]MBA9947377.1 hypothetical protein [Burkholderia cepacia]MBA9977254.1 hypothetical protein [Burkholderia cepacia]MBA9996009.1 hypothetical protein [Burkholderia cepacia]MBB0003892.1 hypothetical protein [Burkholderia cepacia]